MSDFVREAKDILHCFGIDLLEDQPWVVEPEYSTQDQFLIHLIRNERGICMEYKGDHISWFLPKVEEQLAADGIPVDLTVLMEKHRDTDGFYIWLGDLRDVLGEYGMALLYLGGLDELVFFELLSEAVAATLSENLFFQEILEKTDSFLDPDKWGTWTIEDA